MFTIHLDKLEFYAHHGIHEEERVIGTTFEVSITVTLNIKEKVTSIHQTLNYVDVYEIVGRHMKQPVALLELLAENMAEDIYALEDRISDIKISIRKRNPPIAHFLGEVGITFSKTYSS
jgi:7,8-dihydroneopterin aldolase/epimerase/oxygenase